MKLCRTLSLIGAVALALVTLVSSGSAQTGIDAFYNGHKIVIPQSSIPRVGRLQTNYFIVDPQNWNAPQPPPGSETPGSLACVYELVKGPKGCPVSTSTNVPTGGVGAIAIVDAGFYPTAQSDLDAFSSYFGIPKADFTVVYANGKKPPVYSDWEVEESLDIEWAHSMAPKAKLFLVESVLCTNKNCNTDPTWEAVKVASNLVAQHGGGVVSMSWGDPEWAQERNFDHFFTTPGVVYFAASGDSGIGVSIHPGASPNVVSVGGTVFERDGNGDFVSEEYGGGGGDISPYEPRPSYQDGIEKIVGKFRGYPDVGSDFCCAAIYLEGQWGDVGGTSWGTPTTAGIVNAAGQLKKSTADELKMIYDEYANKKEYKAEFYDITEGSSYCKVGWDLCAGVGSIRTYKGK
jgi:kumamolisin